MGKKYRKGGAIKTKVVIKILKIKPEQIMATM